MQETEMEEDIITRRTIDIEKVFREKSPNGARLIPGFVFGYLRRVIHEKEINAFLFNNRHLVGLPFVDMLMREFGANVEVTGMENLPGTGRALVAANHPLGGLDGVVLMYVAGKKRTDILFPVNDILLFLPTLKPLFIPINKHGSNQENLQILDSAFDSEKLILYFPAGLVSRKQNGKIEDLDWKKTFISKAVKFKRDVIPTFVEGSNSNFFYNLANTRKKLGIKANIEMLFLPDEMFKQFNKTIHIIFGKPIPYKTFDKRYNYNEWALRVKKYVYSMGRGNKDPFDPVKDYE
jgi:1-acyl-sn-glycerol-3-phosphate acyltransferase